MHQIIRTCILYTLFVFTLPLEVYTCNCRNNCWHKHASLQYLWNWHLMCMCSVGWTLCVIVLCTMLHVITFFVVHVWRMSILHLWNIQPTSKLKERNATCVQNLLITSPSLLKFTALLKSIVKSLNFSVPLLIYALPTIKHPFFFSDFASSACGWLLVSRDFLKFPQDKIILAASRWL